MAENDKLVFYAPWPVFGKQFNKQLVPVRENFQSLSPLVRAATVDQESSRVDDDLAGWSLGEAGFRNRFRTYYDKTNNEFKVQVNRGTESVPIWDDCLRIRESDCMVTATNGLAATGGFYGLTLPLNLARSQAFSSQNVWVFQHNLNTFPVIVQAVAETGTVLTPTRIDLSDPNVAYFYFPVAQSGTAIVTADSTNAQQFNPFYLTLTQTDAGSPLIETQERMIIRFNSNDFYLVKIENDIAEIRLDRSGLTNTADVSPGFYGITTELSDQTSAHKSDTIRFDSADFSIATAADGVTPVVSVAAVAGSSIIIAESESGGESFTDNTFKVDSNAFYLTTGGDGNPLLSVGFVDLDRTVFDNIEPTPVTVRAHMKVPTIPLGSATESAAIYAKVDPTGAANNQFGVYLEVTENQEDTEAGAIKVIHRGAGDAIYVALFDDTGVALESASFANGSKGIISTNQKTQPGNGTDFGNSTLFQGVWGDDGTGGSTTAANFGVVYAARSLGNAFRVQMQDETATGFAWGQPEFRISNFYLQRDHFIVHNNGEIHARNRRAGSAFNWDPPRIRLFGSFLNPTTGVADEKEVSITPSIESGTGISRFDVYTDSAIRFRTSRGGSRFFDDLKVDQVLTAEAFYMESGGEIFKNGTVYQIRTPAEFRLVVNDQFTALEGGSFGITTPDGVVTNPSHSFINDPDTGLFLKGTNSIGIAAGGAEKAFIDAGGIRSNKQIKAPAFYIVGAGEIHRGINVQEVDGSPAVTDVERILFSNGTVTDDGVVDGRRQVTVTTGSSAGGGGFYGVIFRDGDTVFRDDTLRFNANEFYLTDEGGKPQVNLLGGLVGEANTASNLGAGEGVFSTKAGVDLQFKSLVAGSGVTLTPTANDITIASTGGGGGGFYGVVFKESTVGSAGGSGGTTMRDDTLVFDSTYFYLSSEGNNEKPLLSMRLYPQKIQTVFTSSLEVQIPTDSFTEPKDIVWSVWDNRSRALIPQDVYLGKDESNVPTAFFYFATSTTGRIVLIGVSET